MGHGPHSINLTLVPEKLFLDLGRGKKFRSDPQVFDIIGKVLKRPFQWYQ